MTDALVTRFEQLIVENVKLKDDANDLLIQNEELRFELRDIKGDLKNKRLIIYEMEAEFGVHVNELRNRQDIIDELENEIEKVRAELATARFDLMAAGGKPTGNF